MIDCGKVKSLAEDWIRAWNSHDLEAVMSHYSEDIVFYSPFVVKLAGAPSGALRGKVSLREYFSKAFQAYPDLSFEWGRLFFGTQSFVLEYQSVLGRRASELFILGDDDKIREVRAHYADDQAAS
ncbi:MAG: nuclear transport factor 2 family protein [Deltaproteobacteria bacterium]|nr:nuclear transport factor 2 family protein [Deltaproteobacteria bacterium]